MLGTRSAESTAISRAAMTLRTVARGPWLLPFASALSASQAAELGNSGVPLAMPSVRTLNDENATAVASSIASEYSAMYQVLENNWRGTFHPFNASEPDGPGQTLWKNHGKMVFVASLDACAYESDSLLRWQAFSALAFGARGIFWRGAHK
eukprot:SAG31_NODE_17800_length_657_cov_1.152330_1_plen_150_part_10